MSDTEKVDALQALVLAQQRIIEHNQPIIDWHERNRVMAEFDSDGTHSWLLDISSPVRNDFKIVRNSDRFELFRIGQTDHGFLMRFCHYVPSDSDVDPRIYHSTYVIEQPKLIVGPSAHTFALTFASGTMRARIQWRYNPIYQMVMATFTGFERLDRELSKFEIPSFFPHETEQILEALTKSVDAWKVSTLC